MVGELRDVVFEDIGKHSFFQRTKIPTRRYANQQVAAQLLLQAMSRFKKGEESDYRRTRHFDLQTAFKEGLTLTTEERAVVDRTRKTLDLLAAAFDTSSPLRNRAITVSVVLLALELGIGSKKAAEQLADFINGFVCRLQWQIRKGVDIDEEYRHLLRFQRHLTQASVEKPAVKERAKNSEVRIRSMAPIWYIHRGHRVQEENGRRSWRTLRSGPVIGEDLCTVGVAKVCGDDGPHSSDQFKCDEC